MSASSFRFRYLLGLLCHIALAEVACTPLPLSPDKTPGILASCGAQPNFVSATQLKRWQSFPVDVYVDLGSVPETLLDVYREGVERGIHLWAEALQRTMGRMVKFRVSYSPNAAPVTLSLTAGPLPENAMGITELTFTDELIVNAKIKLARSHYERTPFLVNDLANTTAHEIGHVLGIVDHSPSSEDKMSAAGNFGIHNQDQDPVSLLTSSDLNTLREAYCR